MSNIGSSPCICGKKFDDATKPQVRALHVRNCPQWLEYIQKAAKDPAIRQRIEIEGVITVARSLGVSDCALNNAIRKADNLPIQGKLSRSTEVEYSPEQVVLSIHWLITQNESLRNQLREQTDELQQVRTALAGKELQCKRLLDKQLEPIRFAIANEIKTQALESSRQ